MLLLCAGNVLLASDDVRTEGVYSNVVRSEDGRSVTVTRSTKPTQVRVRKSQPRFFDQIYMLDLPVMAVPVVAYSPETNWEFGAGVAGFFYAGDNRRRSFAQLNGAYTLNRQWYLSFASNLYFDNGWFMQVRAGYRDYPDYWFGIGNGIDEHLVATRYNSRRGHLTIQPQYRLPLNWSVGLNINMLHERTADPVLGYGKTWLTGVGAVVQYDSRDELYYPRRGLFFKTIASYYYSAYTPVGSLGLVSIDLRHYVPIYKDLIFAWQLVAEAALGENKPFQLLPTIGGQDLLRGVRRQMFRDDMALALQAELRIPVWDVLKATVFAGVGDVYNLGNWHWAVPKVSYGAGLRVMFNAAKVNLRFDVARTNVNPSWRADGWSFYLTCTEAF